MYDIVSIEGFRIFKASRRARELYEPLIAEAGRSNNAFLQERGPVGPGRRITGSFVYAHPPNYRGTPTLEWGREEWRGLLRQMRAMGMDTAIFQAAVWKELAECYYPSRAFAGYRGWNVIEPFLEAAREEGVAVFLGGYGSTTGWQEHLTTGEAAREEAACVACLDELLAYREAFEGFYFTSETAYTGAPNPEKAACLNQIYGSLFRHLKAADPSVRILMSPATKFFPGKETEMEEHWEAMLANVPLDILAPQDSIGTCGSRLAHAEEMYRVWKRICERRGIRLWANVELFERSDLGQVDNSIPASPLRVAAQIDAAAPYVEKLVCWEAPHYLFGSDAPEAARLREALLAHGEEVAAVPAGEPER